MKAMTAATAALILVTGKTWADQPVAEVVPSAQTHGVDLRALLLEAGTRLHKTFVWDPRIPEKVDIGSLHERDITYPELVSLLRINGFLVFIDGSTTEVLPDAPARTQPTPTVDPEQLKNFGEEIVSVLIPVKGPTAAQLVPILRPMVPQWGHLVAYPDREVLLLTDRASNARRIVEIVRKIETLPQAASAEASKTP
jgi:general secretion pathway protein D